MKNTGIAKYKVTPIGPKVESCLIWGVLNLLPIPVLDGGQLTLLGIEALRGKPFTEKTENFIYTGGALMVGALMIFAIFNDVARFL